MTEDPIDVIEQAVVALDERLVLPWPLQQGLRAWLAAQAEQAREHQDLLVEARYPTPYALQSVTHRHPVAVAQAILELEAAPVSV